MGSIDVCTDNSQFENWQINCKNTPSVTKMQVLVLIVKPFYLYLMDVCNIISVGKVCSHFDLDRSQSLEVQWVELG